MGKLIVHHCWGLLLATLWPGPTWGQGAASQDPQDGLLEDEAYIPTLGAQQLGGLDGAKPLTLGMAIEQGLRANYDQLIRNDHMEALRLQLDDLWWGYWSPQVRLFAQAPAHGLAQLWRRPEAPGLADPKGQVGISLGEYTLFDWGKGYLRYLNARSEELLKIRTLNDHRREFKLDLILLFFQLVQKREALRAYGQQLKNASFIYRFNRDRFRLGKTTKLQFLQGRDEYLRAQNFYQRAKESTEKLHEQMAYAISDDVGSRYFPKGELRFQKVKVRLAQAQALGLKNNPELLDALTESKMAQRGHDLATRENLPLPKLSLNLGAYSHVYGDPSRRGGQGPQSVGLVGSINATWGLFGEGGMFNRRKVLGAYIRKRRSLQSVAKNQHLSKSLIHQRLNAIKRFERRFDILTVQFSNAEKLFAEAMESYTDLRARFPDLTLALHRLTQSKVALEEVKYEHLRSKILLAKAMGVEELPGEIFENLVAKEEAPSL